METETKSKLEAEFIVELRDCANLLMEKLKSDNYEEASKLIYSLADLRDRHLFRSVGRLTRGLHDAIVNFEVDSSSDDQTLKMESAEIQEASDGLNYVIKMTQQAAEKTMDKVEVATPIALEMGQESEALLDEWRRLKRREMSASEFRGLYTRVDDFLIQTGEGTKKLSQNLQDIILEQGFQDLTGQVLKRVITLIRDVEEELVGLVRIAGQIEEITGISEELENTDKEESNEKKADIEAEGPQIHAETREDVVSGQDEVDDLLSSLGF